MRLVGLLLLLYLSPAYGQELDSNYLAVYHYLEESAEQIREYRDDLITLAGSVKVNELEDLHDFMSANNLYFFPMMATISVKNCLYLWSNTIQLADNTEMLCEGFSYNIAMIELCVSSMQKELSRLQDQRLLLIQGNDTRNYLRKFVTTFKKLSTEYENFPCVWE